MGRITGPVFFLVVYLVVFAAIFVPWMWLVPPSAKTTLKPWLTGLGFAALGIWLVMRFRKRPS